MIFYFFIYLDSNPSHEYVLCVGNPGSGKSTILNCLMTSRSTQELNERQKFKSGAFASGMTHQLDTKAVGGITYLDTPGLDDVNKRKEAAEAITEALKKDGRYQVVFVLTLEAGRVKPADVATMQLILKSATDITRYGVIFNKLNKSVMEKLHKESTIILLTQVSIQLDKGSKKPFPYPLLLQKIEDLEDKDDAVAEIPELEDYFSNLPSIDIQSLNVTCLLYTSPSPRDS